MNTTTLHAERGPGWTHHGTPAECGCTRPEIRLNDDGTLDELVARYASVHLEQMADNSWWMAVESAGQLVHVNFHARGKIAATAEVQ